MKFVAETMGSKVSPLIAFFWYRRYAMRASAMIAMHPNDRPTMRPVFDTFSSVVPLLLDALKDFNHAVMAALAFGGH